MVGLEVKGRRRKALLGLLSDFRHLISDLCSCIP